MWLQSVADGLGFQFGAFIPRLIVLKRHRRRVGPHLQALFQD